MIATGGEENRSRFFNTYFTYGLELGMGLTNWDCLLFLNLVKFSLTEGAITGKWESIVHCLDDLSQSGHFTGQYILVI